MSDFKEKIKTRQDSLKATVSGVLGNLEQNDINRLKAPVIARYDDDFKNREVKEQERFRKSYKTSQNRELDGVEMNIKAPADYAPEDVTVQKRKYGYFSNTKKERIINTKAQIDAWQDSIDVYDSNGEDGFDFVVNKQKVNEDTMDFMNSTRRLAAIEDKKKELAGEILTQQALQALKEKDEHAATALDTYRTVIMNLGPAIEVVPEENDLPLANIQFNEESIERYKAYLRMVAEDPVGAMKAAITDTLHTVTMLPDKMLGDKAIPQTFDRLMQIRNRYNAINRLRKLRQVSGSGQDNHPVAKLMTELYPREDAAADHQHNEHDEHDHDEKDNFEFIKLMEKAINSDMVKCLTKAGISFRNGLFGNKKEKDYIDSDGNAARNAYANMKNNLAADNDAERERKRKLNAEHWEMRKRTAYEEIARNRPQNDIPKTDVYDIMIAVNKIKTEAGRKKNIRYNTQLAAQLEGRISKLIVSIDALSNEISNADAALNLDQVRMSRELSERMKIASSRAQYDLFFLLERAKGYINAYDHTVSGKQLNEHGQSIMEDMKTVQIEDDEWVNITDSRLDVRYSKENVDRMNRIAKDGDKVPGPDVESDRDAVQKLVANLSKLDKDSDALLNDLRNIDELNQNVVIDKLIAFRKGYLENQKLISFGLKNSNGQSAFNAMLASVENEEDRTALMAEYAHTMNKCSYLSAYAESFRLDNIIGTFTGDALPEEIKRTAAEEADPQSKHLRYYKDRRAELKHQMDIYEQEIISYQEARLKKAGKRKLFNADPEAGGNAQEVATALARRMAKVRAEQISEAKYSEEILAQLRQDRPAEEEEEEVREPVQEVHIPVQEREQNPPVVNPPIMEQNPPEDEEIVVPRTRKVKKKTKNIRKRKVGGRIVTTEKWVEYEVEEPIPEDEIQREIERIKAERAEQKRREQEERERREREEREENERREREEREERERQEREEQEERERREREEQQHNGGAGGDDNGGANVPYQKRLAPVDVEEVLNDGSLKDVRDFVGFFAQKLGIKNTINIVTWDELKAEAKAWIVGRKVGRVNINAENADQLIDAEKEYFLGFRDDLVVDPSSFKEEDDAKYDDKNLEDKQFEAKSFGASIKEALNCSSSEEAAVYGVKDSDDDQQDELVKEFKIAFSGSFEKEVGKDNAGNPEEDAGHIRWFLNKLPVEFTMESATAFKKEWDRKVGYDYIKGHKISDTTYKKLKTAYESIVHSILTTRLEPQARRIMEKTKQTDMNAPTQDQIIQNYNRDALNVKQWYRASCWATSGSVIANWYMKNVLKLENPPLIDQETFLHPDVIKVNPYAEKKMKLEGRRRNEYGLAKEKANIESFVQQGGRFGNLMSTADVFLANMSNTAVKHLRWNLPVGDRFFNAADITKDDWKHFVKLFFNKVSELIGSGSGPISLLLPGHYRTIIGIQGNVLKCRDSGLGDGAVEKDFTIEEFTNEFLNRSEDESGHSIELLYLQNITEENKEEIKNRYGVEYDEEGKLVYDKKYEEKHAPISENMIHNLGVAFNVKNDREPEDLLERFMSEELYVPKNLDHTQNVRDVEKEREDLRKELELPDETQQEKQARDAKIARYNENAAKKRQERAEAWRKYAVKPPKTEEELRAEDEALTRKVLKDVEENFIVFANKDEFIAEEVKTDGIVEAKHAFVEEGETLQDKFGEYHKELIEKTRNFYKERSLKPKKDKKERKKRQLPTGMDILNGDYMNKEFDQESDRMLGREILGGHPFGWILSPEDMQHIGTIIGKNGARFVSEITEDKESTVQKRNDALNAIKQGDVSKYNDLPNFLKEYYGRIELDKFFGDDKDYKAGKLPKLTMQIKERLKEKTRDPLFRGAFNLMIKRMSLHNKDAKLLKALREYDSYMNQQLILQTLAPVEEPEKKRLFEARKLELTAKRLKKKKKKKELTKAEQDQVNAEAELAVANEIEENQTGQRHMAKMMFMMQLGRFDIFESTKKVTATKKETITTSRAFDQTIGEAIAHGNRVGISLPAGTDEQQTVLQNAWKGEVTDKMMPGRPATHELSRRKLDDPNSSFKETRIGLVEGSSSKKLTTISGNYGLNLTLGGLGKLFNGGRSIIDNKGRFGHMYQRYRKGDSKTCGGMLIGVENSAPGGLFSFTRKLFGGFDGKSSIGEVHNRKAVSHQQSAFYSARVTDGDKYSGRVVDLSHMDAGLLADILTQFDRTYKSLQETASVTVTKAMLRTNVGKRAKERKETALKLLNDLNELMSGKILTASELFKLLKMIGVDKSVARDAIVTGRSAEHAKYVPNENYSPKEENKNAIGNEEVNEELDELLRQYQEEGEEGGEGN